MSETRELTAAVRHAFIVDEWKPMHRATLRGFCKVTMPSGMILADVAVHLDSGNVLRDQAGKVRYSPIVSFASKELRDRFSVAVIDALLATYPDALG